VSGLDLALHHAARGRRVFPFWLRPQAGGKLGKFPAVRDWLHVASSDPDGVRALWRARSRARPGWRLDDDLMVVDVDEPQRFADAYLDLPVTARQQTPSGGFHMLYRTDGRPVRQTVKEIPGADTRVGGRGFVGLYHEDSFEGAVADAPEWLYAPPEPTASTEPAELTTRNQLLTYAGRMRRAGAEPDEILAALLAARASGRLFDTDEARPWTDAHLKAIADDIGRKPVVADGQPMAAAFEALQRRRDPLAWLREVER
jgi:hypothetical protein